MAPDAVTLLAGMAIFTVILVVILYLVFGKRTVTGNRTHLIRAYRAAPKKVPGAPVLVHGPADSPRAVLLPTTGEPVAFYAAFIMSKDCTLIRSPADIQVLPSAASFGVFITSGDFSVTEAGVTCTVSIVSALEQSREGPAIFSENQKRTVVLDGMPESVFDDLVTAEAAIRALSGVFSITAAGRSVSSSIDTRVSRFAQGRNVPPAIADLLRQKIIRPQPGEEITVAEFFIPKSKNVWVFGTFFGEHTLMYDDNRTGLSVSYTDPEQTGT